jgi:Tfp pilus assembly protein PilN
MLPFLKKQNESEPSVGQGVVPWHTDFRVVDRLPDTKIVRTTFFINTACVSVVVGLFVYIGTQEFQGLNVRRQISEWQAQINRDGKKGVQAIKLFKQFQTEAAKINEIDTFLKSRPALSEVLTHFGETMPDMVAMENLDLRANSMAIRCVARGAPDRASSDVNAYVEQLKADKFFTSKFGEVTLNTLARNPATNQLTIDISFKPKAAPPPPPKPAPKVEPKGKKDEP